MGITICHHSASPMMTNFDPRGGFFYPSLTLMIDSYSIPIFIIVYYLLFDCVNAMTLGKLQFSDFPESWSGLSRGWSVVRMHIPLPTWSKNNNSYLLVDAFQQITLLAMFSCLKKNMYFSL